MSEGGVREGVNECVSRGVGLCPPLFYVCFNKVRGYTIA